MKSLKKIPRASLKAIQGGQVYCPMPSGIPAICPGTVCPANPCLNVNCIVSARDCGSPW